MARNRKSKSSRSRARQPERPPAGSGVRFATLAIDGLSTAAFFLLLPALVESFRHPSSANGLFILGSFLMLIVGVGALRAVKRGGDPPSKPREGGRRAQKASEEEGSEEEESGGCLQFVVICVVFAYAILLTLILGEATGWYPSFSSRSSHFGLLGFGVFVGLLLAVIAAYGIGSVVDPAAPDTRRGAVYQILGVIGVDLVTLVMLAWWKSLLGDPGSGEDVANPLWAKMVLFPILFGLFLAFYAPPRIYLFLANRDRLGLAVFCAILAAYAWHLVSVMGL